jgi:hypothetical protein
MRKAVSTTIIWPEKSFQTVLHEVEDLGQGGWGGLEGVAAGVHVHSWNNQQQTMK